MVGWYHQLNRHELRQTTGDSEGQRSLACSTHGVANCQTPLATEQHKECTQFNQVIYLRTNRIYFPFRQGFPCNSAGKETACNARDLGLIPGLGRSPGEGKGYPLQYSCLENFMDCIVHGVTKSQTQLSNFYFLSDTYTFCMFIKILSKERARDSTLENTKY